MAAPRFAGPARPGVPQGGLAAAASASPVLSAEPGDHLRARLLRRSVASEGEQEEDALLSPDVRRQLAGHDPFDDFSRHFERTRGLDPLSRLLYVDLKTWLANDMLVKVDRMSMANGLEIRSPLLDQRIIEFAATVPSGLKYRGRTSKYLLKRYLETRVPRSVIYRPKRASRSRSPPGFGASCERWPMICCSRHDPWPAGMCGRIICVSCGTATRRESGTTLPRSGRS